MAGFGSRCNFEFPRPLTRSASLRLRFFDEAGFALTNLMPRASLKNRLFNMPNMIADVPCHASKSLMDQLRAWGLEKGFLASDFCDIGLLRRHDAPGVTGWGGFCVAQDLDQAAMMSMESGMDMERLKAAWHAAHHSSWSSSFAGWP